MDVPEIKLPKDIKNPIDKDILKYEEPDLEYEAPETPLEEVYGRLPQVTTTPTWKPRAFRDSLAINTSSNTFYYYDFDNATWKSVANYTAPANLMEIKVIDDSTTLTTGDGQLIMCIPSAWNGFNLVSAHAFVTTASTSGTPTIQIRNVTQTADMLSTRITIDQDEFTSYTAATAPVIDTSNDDVATGDRIAIDVDVAGTGTKGLGVILGFQ